MIPLETVFRNQIESQALKTLDLLTATLKRQSIVCRTGRVTGVEKGVVKAKHLSDVAKIGHRVSFGTSTGEVVGISNEEIAVFPEGGTSDILLDQKIQLLGDIGIYPDESWIGRVLDSNAQPIDGKPLLDGANVAELFADPPLATARRGLGPMLDTGHVVLNTVLPIARGQRIGVFAGSGVGKSSLMAALACDMETDMNVIALIGERGREVGQFLANALGKSGLSRSVVIVATSDQPALVRRRATNTALAIAEYFRDQGRHVMFMLDSVTRFAEAHREIAAAAGETGSVRGNPASLGPTLAKLSERLGPGNRSQGDITALLTVLVPGSDMEDPLADTLRGLLDGHVVLTREIAERGRFPAIDVLRSVSRALPGVVGDKEQTLINETRHLLSTYDESEMMVRSGLYQSGSNPELDRAIRLYPILEKLFAERTSAGIGKCFEKLAASLVTSE